MKRCVCAALIASFLDPGTLLAGELGYAYYLTRPLENSGWTQAKDINDQGGVAGTALFESTSRAFLWRNGVTTNLDDDWEEGAFKEGECISEDTKVSGTGIPLIPAWQNGKVMVMDPIEGCDYDRARDINGSGTMIVGDCEPLDPLLDTRPTVYWTADGSSLQLELLPGSPAEDPGYARGVNDDGVVVGVVGSTTPMRSFIWQDGVMTEIPNLLGGDSVNIRAINNRGLIVGLASTPTNTVAMSYDMKKNEMLVMGDEGRPFGVNDRGAAVGNDIIDFTATHAILYQDGEVIDLHEFLAHAVTESEAWAINNYGWIVGEGKDSGGTDQGWVLIPIYDKGDYDGDGDVDHQDFANFQRCFAAEDYIDGTLHVGCSVFDFDDDNDLGLDDYAAFQSAFTGPTAPNLNPNGPG